MSSEPKKPGSAVEAGPPLARSADAVSPTVVAARGLTKIYEIYDHPRDRLLQLLLPGARKRCREFTAVRGVDLSLRSGEIMGVVGRNGSGKSTLLQMISGILEPSSGELEVVGHVAPILALGIGFNPEFTGRENVLVNGAILGLAAERVGGIGDQLDSIAAFAEIGDFFDQPVKTYSSGMYSRLAFAVAIHADPEILVIDEVLAVGDEAFLRKCFARIETLRDTGSTILFASHAPGLIVELCDRALLMDGGERLLTADPKTVISRYHQLIFSPESARDGVREEIRALDRGGSMPRVESPGQVEDAGEALAAAFDPALLAESTVEYERRGARIGNPRILDSAGRPVNRLRAGASYTYVYDVTFDQPARGVRFGMLIKLTSGFELAGQVTHPEGEGIELVEGGSRASVAFSFRALLRPGTYFLNAGVVGRREDEEVFLHRIVDAVLFRVDEGERGRVEGHVDLTTDVEPRVELGAPAGSAGGPAGD